MVAGRPIAGRACRRAVLRAHASMHRSIRWAIFARPRPWRASLPLSRADISAAPHAALLVSALEYATQLARITPDDRDLASLVEELRRKSKQVTPRTARPRRICFLALVHFLRR